MISNSIGLRLVPCDPVLTRNLECVQAALLTRLSLLTVFASVCSRYHPVLIPARGQHRIRD